MADLKGKPVGPNGEELYQCADCSKLWREVDLATARDQHSRFDDGDIMSHYECPDKDCGALCFPADGEPLGILRQQKTSPLKKHLYHKMKVVEDDGFIRLVCIDCGNKVKRTVTEDEISKPEVEEEVE